MYSTDFCQTYINDALWDRDECSKFWGQKIKGQGRGGIKYALWAQAYCTRNFAIELLISRLARSHYCQQLTLSVCPDGFFFVSRWNRAIFWPSFLHVALYKTLFLDF